MPPPHSHSTPSKSNHLGGDGKRPSPAKFSPRSPSGSGNSPQTPIRCGPRLPNEDAMKIAERRQARQRESMSPTKPLARFESLCEDSKTILTDMTGMFSPGKVETKTPEASSFKIKIEMAVPRVKRRIRSGKDLPEDRRKQGQSVRRRKRALRPRQAKRPAHPPPDPIPEEGSSKSPQQGQVPQVMQHRI